MKAIEAKIVVLGSQGSIFFNRLKIAKFTESYHKLIKFIKSPYNIVLACKDRNGIQYSLNKEN